MEKNITLKVGDLDVIGQLKYDNDNKSEIFLTMPLNKSHYFKKLYDNPEAFNLNGKFKDDCQFTAFYCYVVQAQNTNSFVNNLIAMIDFHSNEESNTLIKYRLEIGKLYLNASNVDDEMSVKKVDVKFSSIEQWIPANETKKVFIKQNNYIIELTNNYIRIELSEPVTLKEFDKIVLDLYVFFEVLVLNNDVKTIEKFIYTVDNTKIEEVTQNKFNQPTKEKFLFDYDANSIDGILNRWFEAKSKYGKIFDYLSGILNESSIVYLELKYFALAQWLEGYSGEKFKFQNKILEKEDKELKKIIKNIINKFDDEDKKLINENFQFKKEDTFAKKVKFLFKDEFLQDKIGFSDDVSEIDNLVNNIKYYRNHVAHLNVKDKLNNEQMGNLYFVLKNIIYIFVMKELGVLVDDKRIKETKTFYERYRYMFLTEPSKGEIACSNS